MKTTTPLISDLAAIGTKRLASELLGSRNRIGLRYFQVSQTIPGSMRFFGYTFVSIDSNAGVSSLVRARERHKPRRGRATPTANLKLMASLVLISIMVWAEERCINLPGRIEHQDMRTQSAVQ